MKTAPAKLGPPPELGLSYGLRRFFAAFGLEFEEVDSAFDDVFVNDVLAALVIRELVHQFEHDLFAHRAKGAGAGVTLERAFGDQLEGTRREFDFAAFEAEELLVLLHER